MTTHDYTKRYWGHDFCITDVVAKGMSLKMMGWGHGIEMGDFLILPNETETTRYRVKEIRYQDDPADMWSITAEFSPITGSQP